MKRVVIRNIYFWFFSVRIKLGIETVFKFWWTFNEVLAGFVSHSISVCDYPRNWEKRQRVKSSNPVPLIFPPSPKQQSQPDTLSRNHSWIISSNREIHRLSNIQRLSYPVPGLSRGTVSLSAQWWPIHHSQCRLSLIRHAYSPFTNALCDSVCAIREADAVAVVRPRRTALAASDAAIADNGTTIFAGFRNALFATRHRVLPTSSVVITGDMIILEKWTHFHATKDL